MVYYCRSDFELVKNNREPVITLPKAIHIEQAERLQVDASAKGHGWLENWIAGLDRPSSKSYGRMLSVGHVHAITKPDQPGHRHIMTPRPRAVCGWDRTRPQDWVKERQPASQSAPGPLAARRKHLSVLAGTLHFAEALHSRPPDLGRAVGSNIYSKTSTL